MRPAVTVLIAIVIAVLTIAAVFGATNVVVDSADDSITNTGGGLITCISSGFDGEQCEILNPSDSGDG